MGQNNLTLRLVPLYPLARKQQPCGLLFSGQRVRLVLWPRDQAKGPKGTVAALPQPNIWPEGTLHSKKMKFKRKFI